MSVIIETSIGDVTVDLYTDERPRCCMNFLKLCKIKYYNFSLFHTVQQNVVAQTGDPTATGRGGESIFGKLYGEQARFFDMEVIPQIKHFKKGLVSMVNNGSGMHGSQFFFTLADNLDYLDGKHTVFGEVAEGFDVLDKLNNTFGGEDNRPHQDIRIYHTIILDDPYNDPNGLKIPAMSPGPTEEMLNSDHIPCDANIDEDKDKTEEELMEMMAEKEAKANTQILEMVGDLPEAEVAPPDNVLFVCKLNPVTTAEDLEVIFSRFGPIVNCEVIKDSKTGESLQYAFVEFENQEHCESAFFKMDNVLIDDRRIHVDFSQSVSKLKWKGKGKGVEILPTGDAPVYVLKNQQRQNDGYELVYEHDEGESRGNKRVARQQKKKSYKPFDDEAERFDRTDKRKQRSRSTSPDVRKRNEDARGLSRREDRQKDAYRDRAEIKDRKREDYSNRRAQEDRNIRRDDEDVVGKRDAGERRLHNNVGRRREEKDDRRDERDRVERKYGDKERERREQRLRGYDDRDDDGAIRNKSNGRGRQGKNKNEDSDDGEPETKKRNSSKRANSSDESEPETKKRHSSKRANSSDESEPETKKRNSSKRSKSSDESEPETKKRNSSRRAKSSDESEPETKKRNSSKRAKSGDESEPETKKRNSSKRANSSDESEPETKKRYSSKRANSSDDSDQDSKQKRKEKKKGSKDKVRDSDSSYRANTKPSSAVKKKKKSKKKHKSRNHSSSSSDH